MPELIARGSDVSQQWRRSLRDGEAVRVGRSPAAGWSVPWDDQISREHIEVVWRGGRLHVRSLETARNPVFFRGQSVTQLQVSLGEHFVIGRTSFHVAADVVAVSAEVPAPREQHTFRPGELRRVQFRNADHRLEVLTQLPELIAESSSDEIFSARLVGLLLAGIPGAEAAALVRCVEPESETASRSDAPKSGGAAAAGGSAADEPHASVRVLQWDRRRDAAGRFQPSQRLILEAVGREESVLHVWSDPGAAQQAFTISDNLDWALCTPVPGEACRGWALYVAGSTDGSRAAGLSTGAISADRKEDLRFAELVAEMVGALRQVRRLEIQRAQLGNFLSPVVLEAISGDAAGQALAPRETDVTVLFCDLRGFSKEAEHWRSKLVELLNRVSEALGVMTHYIVRHGGAIGDFQGDAAMGFWGLPIPPSDGPLSACLAALDIRSEFRKAAGQQGHPLADFRAGIGIAHGRAVAGRIGTADHAQLTVFGPVANLASRLEGMTKQLRVPILLDEATADYVRRQLPSSRGRCRRLGRIRPYGLGTPLMVSELLPPVDRDSTLSDQNLTDFDAAVDAVLAGRWTEALELLHKVPAQDRAKDFLTIFIAQNNYEPPANWDGVIPMPAK
jgi:adenylate cyclase